MTPAPRPRILDLFCGDGGAGMGYHLAGFDVVGVDIVRHRRYPFEFVQADALSIPFDTFDAVHASPPCQRFSKMGTLHNNRHTHPDLIGPVRALLQASGLPFVIENVEGAPLRADVTLCGSMFGLGVDGFYLRRHRVFEVNFDTTRPRPCAHGARAMGVYGHGRGGGDHSWRSADKATAAAIMEMPWATRDGIAQAIPPAYTEWIGGDLIVEVERRRRQRVRGKAS